LRFLFKALRHYVISAEARWYDWRHNVETRVDQSEHLRGWNYNFPYLPIRPPTARRVVRSLPIENYSDYTFIDIGSSKGRMLLLASEFPFRKIVGVEMREDLHAQALENVRRFRQPNMKCSQIDCRLEDAIPARYKRSFSIAASAAIASGFLLVSLSKMTRRSPTSLCLGLLTPRHFRSRLATSRSCGLDCCHRHCVALFGLGNTGADTRGRTHG
jgi:hypothetical protein